MLTTELHSKQSPLEKAQAIVNDSWEHSQGYPDEERKEYIAYAIAAYFRDAAAAQPEGLPCFIIAKNTKETSFVKMQGKADEVIALICHHLDTKEVREMIFTAIAIHASERGNGFIIKMGKP